MSTKTLLLLRHAKSSWDHAEVNDHDRPLNARGRKAASRMGRLLHNEPFAIELVLCSTSVRTRETAKLVFAEQKKGPAILYRDDLYHASAEQITTILSQVAEPTSCVLVIGHNPGFEEFLAHVTGTASHFPTAALAWIELKMDRWSSFDAETRGTLQQIWCPRDRESE